ncbi:MAG TPA: hypothetical protein VJS92_07915 [Candidatus Polarisedimenticolaceae bacterium]|nr:hypothetical protein [Candidatus Polarisedimenticolaceae bacterium]
MNGKTLSLALLVVALALSTSCKRSEPAAAPSATPQVSVVAVTLGRELGTDKKVLAASESFAPGDTIYASVDTQGAAATASLAARWKYQDGQTVHEESQAIAPLGPATTEFHVSKPDGWPQGSYTVEILLNGVSVRTASFRVG